MPVTNEDIAKIFDQIADILEIKGDNPYRVRAYRNAARIVGGLTQDLCELVERGEDLTKIPGIGDALAKKIVEIVKTGSLRKLEELKKDIPPGLLDLLKIPGLGPKKVRALYEKLGIENLEQLKQAAQEGKIRALEGFGARTEQKILEEIDRVKKAKSESRILLSHAEKIAGHLVEYLKSGGGIREIQVAGSFRRRKETVGDLDILVISDNPALVMDNFVAYDVVDEVLMKGETRSSVVLKSGVQVDLRVVPEDSYGAALQYFTGSKAHNIAVRKIAQKAGLKINEYGVFRGEEKIAGATEEEVYAAVGLPWIPPELREDRGEIEAALEGKLPNLIELSHIRGDLHTHTNWTDGHNTVEEMALAAKSLGYEYIAITDHSKHTTIAGGLDEAKFREQIEQIRRINEKIDGIRILSGAEVDILEDGSLDLPDELLAEFDIVVAAVHYKFDLPRDRQTERIIRAIRNPNVDILAHPTGRLIGERKPYEVDLEEIIKVAARTGTVMELNANPQRLDLNDIYCKFAREMGVRIAISTDAHTADSLNYMRFGIGQARRGWLEPDDVINTLPLDKLLKFLHR